MDLTAFVFLTALLFKLNKFWESTDPAAFRQLVALSAFAAYARYETLGIVALFLAVGAARAVRARLSLRHWLPPLCLLPAALFPLLILITGPSQTFVNAGSKRPRASQIWPRT